MTLEKLGLVDKIAALAAGAAGSSSSLARAAPPTTAGDWPTCSYSDMYVGARAAPPFVVRPLAPNASEEHWFGYTRRMQPLH